MDNKNIEIKSNNYTVDINNNKYELSLNYKDTHTLLLNKQGPRGPKGEQGEIGERGPQGEAGPSNVLSIGTVSNGDNAEATITGTSPNQVLNLVLPKGDKGDRGEQGPQGPQGIAGISNIPIGTIIPVNATSNYVPNGCLPCDGTQYSKAQFEELWTNFLTTKPSLLNTCTYAEYTSDLSTYGQCAKFAVDTVNNKFRVPFIKDGAVIQQALTDDELGKSYNAGLPNITGKVVSDYSSNWEGAFYDGGTINGGGGSGKDSLAIFDASRSSSIYGNSDTVQPNAVALRYFVVVANGQTNQSMMDWSAWASSLQGKANTDLSNLSDVGKKVIDGQWVAKEQVLSTTTAVGTYILDLSSYLPNDNYDYEVLIYIAFRNDSSKGSTMTINGIYEVAGHSGTGSLQYLSILIPILNSDRKITKVITGVRVTSTTIKATQFRRIGTNQ